MTKKEKAHSSKSGFFDSFREGFSMIADIGINSIVGNLRAAAEDAMDDAKKRLQETVKDVLKLLSIFFMMVFGIILAIVGLGKYLSETVPALNHGLGYVVLGGIFIFLGLLVQFFRK